MPVASKLLMNLIDSTPSAEIWAKLAYPTAANAIDHHEDAFAPAAPSGWIIGRGAAHAAHRPPPTVPRFLLPTKKPLGIAVRRPPEVMVVGLMSGREIRNSTTPRWSNEYEIS
jgi:hypothetical protein